MTVVWQSWQALERDAEGGTALHSAAGDGKTMVVSALLDAGVDVGMGHGGWTALHEVRLPPAMSHRAAGVHRKPEPRQKESALWSPFSETRLRIV